LLLKTGRTGQPSIEPPGQEKRLKFLIVLVVYPETKGVSLEAMEERVESIAPWPSGITASDDYKEV